tara:strand:- start:154 stop:1257 length:1104 start_codon:yes stop_codon:yes gene_type:complete
MQMDSSGLDITGDLTLTSTDAGSTENPTLDLYRNSSSPADNDVIGHIVFNGENDAGEKIQYAEIESRIIDASDGSEDGRLVFSAMLNGTNTNYYSPSFGFNLFFRDVLLSSGKNLLFEGATSNGTRTTLTVTDPTADRTITLPDASGTVALIADPTFTGTVTAPTLRLTGTTDVTASSTEHAFQIGASSGLNIAIDGNEIMARNNGVTSSLFLNAGGSLVQIGGGLHLIGSSQTISFEGSTDDSNETSLVVTDPTADRTITLPDSTGTVQVTSSSDRRLKKNIEPASSASQKIDDINVYQFDWIEDGKHEDFGVVAQEMQEVFPDCVAVQDPETGYLGIDYSKLVPVLLKEIKDLRARVADLENKDG